VDTRSGLTGLFERHLERHDWAATGFKDTLLRREVKPEMGMGIRRQVNGDFNSEAVRPVRERGVSVAKRRHATRICQPDRV
jgi:hypothetical protein